MKVRFLTDPEELEQKWDAVAELLAPSVENAAHGEFTLSDIRAAAEKGSVTIALCTLNGDPQMAFAVEFKHYPRYMNLNIIALGGTMMDEFMRAYFETLKEWARGAGATEIQASCRPAMARMLERYGYVSTYHEMRVSL
jgi:hypothetical protein